jgi:tetratricopeptide (TPR) repeat protein
MERQQVLHQSADPLRRWAVMDEAVLRRQVGGADVMRQQIRHMAELSEAPNITVQVLSEDRAHPALDFPFCILIADLSGAIALNPGDSWAHCCRGTAYRQSKRYREAVADLTTAIGLKADYDWALAQRGAAHRLQGRFAEAVQDFSETVRIDPGNTWAAAQCDRARRKSRR